MKDPLEVDLNEPKDPLTPKDVIDSLSHILSSKENRDRFKKAVIHNKPDHWSSKSNAPYYREQWAKVAQITLDRMISSGKNQVFYYSDFPESSPNTIYNRFTQGKQYLMDHMDSDGKYKSLNQIIFVKRKRGVGLIISLRKDLLEIEESKGNLDRFLPKEICESTDEWRDRMEEWIDHGNPNVPFVLSNIALSPDEIEALRLELNDLPNVAANITNNSIKLVKINI